MLKRASLPIALLLCSGATNPAPTTHAAYSAALLGPGVISTRDFERDGSFTPDGHTFYFTKRTMWPYFSAICLSRFQNGHWSTPEVAPFSGRWADATPFVAPDGSALYFASRRPVPNSGPGYHLWVVDRAGDGWGAPRLLPDVVNASGSVVAPVITTNGSLYFIGGPASRVMRAERDGSTWKEPVAVESDTSANFAEVGVYVSPDDRIMVLSILGRDDALHSAESVYPRSDLYVRERVNGAWGPVRHLPVPINSAANEGGQPTMTPDGKYLVFTSERGAFTEHGKPLDFTTLERQLHTTGNGLGDIYEIDARALGLSR